MQYPITPCPKPRMTRSDKWKKRDCVLRYRAFCDECRARGVNLPVEGAAIHFVLPMPKSWSKKKREEMNGQPHQQKPDLSNLLKALEDAVLKDDSVVWGYSKLTKVWGEEGSIQVLSEQEKVSIEGSPTNTAVARLLHKVGDMEWLMGQPDELESPRDRKIR